MSRMKPGTLISICRCAVLLSLLLARRECASQVSAQQPQIKATAPNPSAPTPEVQGFTVTLTYSSKANETLAAQNETVIVAGYLTCFPRQGTPKRLVDHEDQVSLGEIHDEVALDEPATFKSIKLDSAGLKWANDQGPQLLINVYSGRKSSPNNLLDCGIYQGPLEDVQGKSIPISCKLIGE
jgi:hypothetical protein